MEREKSEVVQGQVEIRIYVLISIEGTIAPQLHLRFAVLSFLKPYFVVFLKPYNSRLKVPQECYMGVVRGVRGVLHGCYMPLQTSDMGKKTVSVLAHKFFLPYRANSVYILSITLLRYFRS